MILELITFYDSLFTLRSRRGVFKNVRTTYEKNTRSLYDILPSLAQ